MFVVCICDVAWIFVRIMNKFEGVCMWLLYGDELEEIVFCILVLYCYIVDFINMYDIIVL